MKMINAIIIDDESKCVELLTLMLESAHPEICILDTADGMASGLKAIQKHAHHLDLLFLDIQMQGGDGFTLLQNLDKPAFKIIFTTAFDQFAIRAFKFSALDYLLKPVDKDELLQAIEKFRLNNSPADNERLGNFKTGLKQQKVFEKLAVATLTDIRFIPLHTISYLESDNNYTSIYLNDGQRVVSSRNIGYYETILEESNFFRLSNSNLVNLKKVLRFIKNKTGMVELEGGKIIQVSASKKEKLLRLMDLC